MIPLQQVGPVITAVGGLGAAAFGFVDATKVFWGGVNHLGFKSIRVALEKLTPAAGAPVSGLNIPATLKANWMNGADLGSQKSIAKALIKLNLNAGNAAHLAAATGVDPTILTAVATKIAAAASLSSSESDVLARFDFTVTALLDEAYQRSDQVYRNSTRALAMVVSVALALAGGYLLHTNAESLRSDLARSFLVGLLATPLAPIAKDLSTALATAVNSLQLAKK
jgi:hypothetical protein